MTPEEIEAAAHKGAAAGTSEALAEDRKQFYVDAEQHYRHHQFLDRAISFCDKTAGTIWGRGIRVLVGGNIKLLRLLK